MSPKTFAFLEKLATKVAGSPRVEIYCSGRGNKDVHIYRKCAAYFTTETLRHREKSLRNLLKAPVLNADSA